MSGLRTNGPSNSPRLEREIVTMKKCPPSGISCYPKDDAQKNVLSASKYILELGLLWFIFDVEVLILIVSNLGLDLLI